MDLNFLVQTFNLTVNPQTTDDIKQGENILEQFQSQPGYCLALIMIVAQKEYPFMIRQAAVTNLKNNVERHWKPKEQNKFMLHQQDKDAIKVNVVDALINSIDEPLIRVHYEKVIKHISQHDFPQLWPNIIKDIFERISNENNRSNEYFGSIMSFKNIVNNYQYHLNEERRDIDVIVEQTFPVLLNQVKIILSNYNHQCALSLKEIMKIFHASIFIDLPRYFENQNNLNQWMIVIKTILDSSLPQNLEEIGTNIDEKNIFWANKKWCSKIIVRILQRYCNKKFMYKDKSGFAEFFKDQYSVSFLESFVTILFKSQTHFVTTKLIHLAFKYIYYSLPNKKTFENLQQLYDNLMFQIFIPSLYITQKDDELWKNDPEEYIRREVDDHQTNTNNKNTITELIVAFCDKKDHNNKQFVLRFVIYMSQKLQNPNIDLLLKEALFYAFCALQKQIIENDQIKLQVEQLIEKYVIPDLSNPVGFLRARACELIGLYAHIPYQNQLNIQNSVQGIYHCLNDSQIPVKFQAAIAMEKMLAQKTAEDILRPVLQSIFTIYIKLLNQIDNEELLKALEGFVECFQNELVPFALELTIHLNNAYYKYCNNQKKHKSKYVNYDDDQDDDDEETEYTAQECLETIQKIIKAPLPQQIYLSINNLMIPTFNKILIEQQDHLEEGIQIINLLLYKNINIDQTLWMYFPIFCYMITGLPQNFIINDSLQQLDPNIAILFQQLDFGSYQEYLSYFLGCFYNFIGKGQELFLNSTDFFGKSFLQLLIDVINHVYQIGLQNQDDQDMMCVTTLYIILMENNIGKIDHLIPFIIDSCIKNLSLNRTMSLKVVNIEVISIALWYNTRLTLSILEEQNQTFNLFQFWFQNLKCFKCDFDKIRTLLGLSSIFYLRQNELPQCLQVSYPQMIKELVKLTTELLELREKNKDEIKSEADEDDLINNNLNNQNDDDEDDDDDDFNPEENELDEIGHIYYDSYIEKVDEILYLQQVLQEISINDQQFYVNIMQNLDQNEQIILQNNFNQALEQKHIRENEQKISNS